MWADNHGSFDGDWYNTKIVWKRYLFGQFVILGVFETEI